MKTSTFIAAAALATAVLTGAADAAVTLFEPGSDAYRSIDDSPWLSSTESNGSFWLEDFEDGALNTLGVTASTGIIRGPSAVTDSVDGDDGSIDWSGQGGYAMLVPASGADGRTVTFTFDNEALGGLPTAAGIVWTDGASAGATVTFEAFDALGQLVASFDSYFERPIDQNGTAYADRFLGLEYAGGIGSIVLTSSNGALELDHLQYGLAGAVIPVPAPLALGLAGLGLVGVARRRKKRA